MIFMHDGEEENVPGEGESEEKEPGNETGDDSEQKSDN